MVSHSENLAPPTGSTHQRVSAGRGTGKQVKMHPQAHTLALELGIP